MSPPIKKEGRAEAAPPNSLYSQSVIVGDTVYLSGITGVDWATNKLVEGTVGDRTVRHNQMAPFI